jgi:hypothetical protein
MRIVDVGRPEAAIQVEAKRLQQTVMGSPCSCRSMEAESRDDSEAAVTTWMVAADATR